MNLEAAPPPARVRERLREAMAELQAQMVAGADGYALARLRSEAVDAAVQALAEHALAAGGDGPAHVALFAVGGYGRRHLAPGSDVDLLLVHGAAATTADLARLERRLWDAGLQPSLICADIRGLPDAWREPHTATAFLDARILAGDPGVADAVAVTFRRQMREHGPALARALMAELELPEVAALRERNRLEPNLKRDPFLLRDIQRIHWLGRILQRTGDPSPFGQFPLLPAGEGTRLADTYGFLLRVRTALHLLAGRREDAILMPVQAALATALGYDPLAGEQDRPPAERFLRDLYTRARDVQAAARQVVERLEQDPRLDLPRPRLRTRRWVAPGYVRVGQALHLGLPPAEHWGAAPSLDRLVEPFLLLLEGRLVLPCALRNALRDAAAHAPPPDGAALARAGALFRRLLAAHQPVAPLIVDMHGCDVLGRLLPEFGALTCAVEFSLLHQYTIDAHSLLALVECESFIGRRHPRASEPFHIVFESLADWAPLRLAALLHDCGKVRPGRHAETGSALAAAAAARLGFSADAVAEVRFLVREHLLLSHACQQRDTEDAALLASLARRIGTRRRLSQLLLLTYADMRTVREGAWTQWRAEQLLELYRGVAAQLEEAHAGQTDFARALALYQPAPGDALTRAAIVAHAGGVLGVDYTEQVPFLRIVEHAAAALCHRAGSVEVAHEQRPHCTRLRVVADDAPGFFATLAGVLTGCGLQIVQGRCFTRRDGVVIDELDVQNGRTGMPPEASAWPSVEERLRAALSGRLDVAELVARQRRTFPAPASVGGRTRFSVQVDHDAAAHCTVLDVRAGDRAGLLYDLGRVLARFAVCIRFVKISTHAGQAVDSFYVVDAAGARLAPDLCARLVNDLRAALA
jgi:[protein-PII] uridylyltransferase